MAVDKNFVVKNGASKSLFADTNTKSVGIEVTNVSLDVRGGIAATDGHFSGIITAQNVNVANYVILNGTNNVSGIATFTGELVPINYQLVD